MRRDWDERALVKTPATTLAPEKSDWSDDEFFRSGEQTVSEEILTGT